MIKLSQFVLNNISVYINCYPFNHYQYKNTHYNYAFRMCGIDVNVVIRNHYKKIKKFNIRMMKYD